MGVAHYELAEYKKAIEYQKKAVEIDPEHAFAWLAMAGAYGQLGERIKVDECQEKAAEFLRINAV